MAKLTDELVLKSLIGSKIIDFRFEAIPNRKTMYKLIIITDAKHVSVPSPSGHAEIITSRLELRVKVK